ncbi:MAG: MBL fold metallo-hydrolase [Chloroflexi bacterium]|nr:MBL fold metallo-hydrolase [Chloroflexota bacterium]
MRITCLVDNTAATGSALWAEHGLSVLIESAGHYLLWDTGQSGTVLLHNLQTLHLDDVPLSGLALSHAHYDHTGGLDALLTRYGSLPIYAHTSLFTERFSRRGEETREIGLRHAAELQHRAHFSLSTEAQALAPGVWTSGDISPRPYPQGSSPHHWIQRAGRWLPDPYEDDLSLILRTREGLVLLCGCCHAGLRNTLRAARARHQGPLRAIVGGTHLVTADDTEIGAVIAALHQEGLPQLYLNHCTGNKALFALQQAFGDLVRPCPAGTVLEFPDEEGS